MIVIIIIILLINFGVSVLTGFDRSSRWTEMAKKRMARDETNEEFKMLNVIR